jgi:hypothetical protein
MVHLALTERSLVRADTTPAWPEPGPRAEGGARVDRLAADLVLATAS